MRPDVANKEKASFAMLSHGQGTQNNRRYFMLAESLDKQFQDGFNTVDSYTKIMHEYDLPLFTHLLIKTTSS